MWLRKGETVFNLQAVVLFFLCNILCLFSTVSLSLHHHHQVCDPDQLMIGSSDQLITRQLIAGTRP